MISLSNILTISKYESKVLWRNWFFRIFSIGILLFLLIFDMAAFSPISDSPWFIKSSSWGPAYTNMLMSAIPQAAAIIFLATGLVKKNKKIDTTEVFFARAISNADYVFGKALALFKLFFWLNVAILVMGMIYNLTNPVTYFNPLAYIFYPLLISMPSIVFTAGLAFLLVTLLRNQPVSIILLLGFSGVILIYFFGKYSGIYDYMAFRLNLMASDIAGFSNLSFIILHRSFYFVAGITFLVATAFFLDRLSNQIKNKISLGIIATIFAGIACYLMVSLWAYRNDAIKLREDMVALNGQWANTPNIQILSNHLKIDHVDDQIKGTSEMRVSNTTEVTLDTLFFTLNPGLEVTQITIDQQAVDFQKELHIISIPQKNGIAPGQKSIVKMNYQGVILEEAAHLEVEQKRYETIDGEFVYAIEKRYAFVQTGYALLTKDVLWYPNNTIGYSQSSPVKESGSFIDFKLDVKAAGNTIPISQGRVEKAGDYYQFRPEYPLSQISLTIGDYEKKALVVDSISYEIYYHKGNDYFSESFNELGDTLGLLVKDLITIYEHDQQLNYPFERLQLVEAPIHFKAYNKIHVGHQAFVQPEIVFWPEKGGSNRDFDLKRQFRNMDRQARQENQVLSDKEKQANVFNTIIKKVFTKQLGDRWFFDGRDADEADYSIFPNLYAYNSGVVSDKWTLLNKGVAEYLNEVRSPENDFSRNINGISFTEECNQLMQEAPLMEVLTKETEFSRIQKSVALKGEYLFS